MKIDKVGLDLFGFDLNILPRKLKISAEKMINNFFFLHFFSEENYEKIVPKENRNHSSGAAAERSEATSIEHGRVAVYKTLREVKHQLGRQQKLPHTNAYAVYAWCRWELFVKIL